MTNPNTGVPITMNVPEVLEGAAPFAAEVADRDDSANPAELSRMVQRLCVELDHCGNYGQQLWHHLELVATYLRDDIAHGDSAEGNAVLLDDAQRNRWAELYSETLRLLAGPHGDNGYGREQARRELQNIAR